MAKVIYPPTVSGIVGRVTTGVYYRARSTRFGYLRSYVMPKITEHNTLLGSYLTNIRKMWAEEVQEAYKEELLEYAKLYKDLPIYGDDSSQRTKSSFAIWYKILSYWQKMDPVHIDLASVTGEDLLSLGEDIISVSKAVEFGAIPVVDGYEAWTASMVAGA